MEFELFDSHAHLSDEMLYENITGIITDANKNNIKNILCASCDLKSSELSVNISESFDCVWSSVGIHPHDAKNYDEITENALLKLCTHKKVVAFGEIGLDYYYDFSDRQTQKAVFIRQLHIAKSLKLPLILHIRDAYGDALEIIQNNLDCFTRPGLIHCYSGSIETMRILLKLGFYFSFGGAITFKNASKLIEVVKECPLDRILLETDSPYMTPVPLRGRINEPQNIVLVCEKLANIKNMKMEDVAKISTNNAKTLFGVK